MTPRPEVEFLYVDTVFRSIYNLLCGSAILCRRPSMVPLLLLRIGDLIKATPAEQIDSEVADNSRSFGMLYARHWAELCGYVTRTFGAGPPDPQDIVQQTFLHFVSRSSTDKVENARAYLYRTAHNILMEEHRRAAVGRAAAAEMTSRHGSSVEEVTPERVLIADERMRIMREVVTRQPEARRRSFLMHRLDGLSCAEIARNTGYSESAIKKHIMQVMTDLEAAMTRWELPRPRPGMLGDSDECDACIK